VFYLFFIAILSEQIKFGKYCDKKIDKAYKEKKKKE